MESRSIFIGQYHRCVMSRLYCGLASSQDLWCFGPRLRREGRRPIRRPHVGNAAPLRRIDWQMLFQHWGWSANKAATPAMLIKADRGPHFVLPVRL